MKIPFYHVDAFTDRLFSGNPAAVVFLTEWMEESVLQKLAIENNLPVTAFVVREKNEFSIRWFTPDFELDLCGHGTLASSYVIFNYIDPSLEKIEFQSKAGVLPVYRQKDLITLNLPEKSFVSYRISDVLVKGLGLKPKEAYVHNNERLLVVFENEDFIKELQPNMDILKQLNERGIVVTAASNKYDFVSRTFYPKKTLTEDAVTGASHCILVPYWAKKLGKNNLHAIQVSKRGGELTCEYKDNRVFISSKAILYAEGTILIK